LLLSYKVRYPTNIFLLRGNHESKAVSKLFGFFDEINLKYGSTITYEKYLQVFNAMPLAALINIDINRRYLCVHGGISPELKIIDDIFTLDRISEIPFKGPITDIVWSDPGKEEYGW